MLKIIEDLEFDGMTAFDRQDARVYHRFSDLRG